MAFATYNAIFSDESIIRNGLNQLGCSIQFLTAVTEDAPSPSLISLWLGGSKNLDSSVTQPLVKTIRTLQEIVLLCHPWPLNFRNNAQLWKQLLEDYRKNKEAAK
jgi:hypothetical protein